MLGRLEVIRQVGYGNRKAVEQYLKEGGDLNFYEGCDYCHEYRYVMTPLQLAIYMRHDVEYIKWLVEIGADPNHQPRKRRTTIDIAVRFGTRETLLYLVSL